MENKNELIKQLKASPLFALSRCSIELAHSNFWAWLIELTIDDKKTHPFLKVFVKEKDLQDIIKSVEREKKHYDLSIQFNNGKSIIIENKFKSIPNETQLSGYQNTAGNAFIRGIVTGIDKEAPFDISNNCPGWQYLSYEEIIKEIRNVADKLDSIQYKQIILDYCVLVENIICLINQQLSEHDNKYYFELNDELETIKLNDVVMKIMASRAASYLNKMIENAPDLKSSKFDYPKADASFNHKKPTITCVYRDKEEKEETFRLGVQIEGNQFRIYGGYANLDQLPKSDKVFEIFARAGFFENKTANSVRGKKSRMRDMFCKYEAANYIHIYQYYNLDEAITLEKLFEEMKPILIKAKEIIDEGKITDDYN